MANKLLYAIKHPERIYLALNDRGLLNWVNDKEHLKMMYRCSFGKKLDLDNPKTYNVGYMSGSQNVVSGPATSTSSGN